MSRGFILSAVVAATVALTGCGGGGGGDGGQQKPPDTGNPSGVGAGGVADVGTPATPPDLIWSADTDSYMTALSAGMRAIPPKTDIAMSIEPSGSEYVLNIQSGTFNGSWFTLDQHLDAARIPLHQTERELLGFKTTQFEGTIGLPGYHAYAVSFQTLTNAGFSSVGIGHWKYLGDTQPGYFSGTHVVHGAFLIGQPSSAATVATVASGVYTGFSQAGGESHWFDAFDQAAMKTSVQYDAKSHRISIRLSSGTYWGSYFEADGRMSVSWDSGTEAAFSRQGLVCSGPVDPSTGAFTCDFASRLHGRIKGRFFGAHGEYVAGTYALAGGISSPISDDGLVGGFVTKLTAVTPSAATGAAWTLTTPGPLSLSTYVANATSAIVHVNAPNIESRPVYAVAIDTAGDINPDVSVTQTDGSFSAYDITISTGNSKVIGSRSGSLQLRLCYDDPLVCAQPVSRSPWTIPYQIDTKVYPGPGTTITPAKLEASTYDGQLLDLGTSIVINQPSVVGNADGTTQQYRYTVLDSGILDPKTTTGFWGSQMPNSFMDAVLRFTLKPGESVGIYEGVVTLSICGFSYSDQPACLPVEQPTLTIPYKVEVKSWTDMRPTSVAPEIKAIPNQRASADERMTFPLTVKPQDISSRWKIPDTYDLVGVGQGFLYGLANNRSPQTRLDVLSEDDGHVIWSINLPTPAQYTDYSYANAYSVSASNDRLYVRLGEGYGFVLQVYDAATGKLLLEKRCPECQRLMEQEYAKGWVVHVYGPQYHPNTQKVWIYDAQSNSVAETPLRDYQIQGLTAAERTQIRDTLLNGAPTGATAAPGTSSLCSETSNIFAYPRLTANYSAACYYPALSGVRWSLDPAQQPDPMIWQSAVNPLEANGTLVNLFGQTALVRDAKDGHEISRIQDQVAVNGYSTLARSSNLIFLGQDVRIAAIDIATKNVVWTLPYAGRIVGISNAGVLYVRLTFGITYTRENWQLVAINLRP